MRSTCVTQRGSKILRRGRKFLFWGTGIFDTVPGQFEGITGWPGAYTVLIMPVRLCLALSLILPSGRSMKIAISDDPAVWNTPALRLDQHGELSLIVPQIPAFIGHMPLPRFLAHKTDAMRSPELTELEAKQVDRSRLPPCR
jgi:hypothetical protein